MDESPSRPAPLIQLNHRYRDRITGFEGTAVARTEYLGGRVTICLERGDSTQKTESLWVDTFRLEPLDTRSTVGFHI